MPYVWKKERRGGGEVRERERLIAHNWILYVVQCIHLYHKLTLSLTVQVVPLAVSEQQYCSEKKYKNTDIAQF